MAGLVQIRGLPWGVVQDQEGDVASGVVLGITDLALGAVTVRATNDPAGAPQSPVSDAFGEVAGWIAPGSYLVTNPLRGTTTQVEVPVSVTSTDIAVLKEAPLNPMHSDYGAEGDGTSDDAPEITAALGVASAAGGGQVLLDRKYAINSLVTVPPNVDLIGVGSLKGGFKATAAAAGIVYGGDVGSASIQDNGRNGGWFFDGNSLSTVGVRAHTKYALFEDVRVTKVNGPGFRVLGQNNDLLAVFATDNAGAGITLDNGAGGNHIKGSTSSRNNGPLLLIQNSAAPSVGAYAEPRHNIWEGGLLEHPGAPSFGTAGTVAVRQYGGSFNRLKDVNVFSGLGSGNLLELSPNPVGARNTADTNGRLIVDGGIWTGSGGGTTQVGLNATATPGVPGDSSVVLLGNPTFSSLLTAIASGSSQPVLDGAAGLTYYGVTNKYVSSGAGLTAVFTLDEGLTTPALLNSWVAFGAPYPGPGYHRRQGVVQLNGVVKSGVVGTGTPIFNLPANYRPSNTRIFPTVSNDVFGVVQVAANGDVSCKAGSNVYVSLEGVRFRVLS